MPLAIQEAFAEFLVVVHERSGILSPLPWQPQELKKIPGLVSVHLHRCRRCEVQGPPGAVGLHVLQKSQQGVRRPLRLRARSASVMRLVDEYDVPGPGGEDLIATASTTSQVGAGKEYGKRAPRIARTALDLLVVDIEEAPAIKTRDAEGELLGEFLLPLLEDRGGHEQQDALGSTRNEEFPDDQSDLDRFAQTDFVRKEVASRVALDRTPRDRLLMRPWRDTGGGEAHLGTAGDPWCGRGKDLVEHFDYIYRQASRYCVMFISAAYAAKPWARHERRSALARALEEEGEYILPARFDDTELPGLRPTVHYLDLREIAPATLVEFIVEKLET